MYGTLSGVSGWVGRGVALVCARALRAGAVCAAATALVVVFGSGVERAGAQSHVERPGSGGRGPGGSLPLDGKPGEKGPLVLGLRLGPIPGLTTAWHDAPLEEAMVPVGTVVRLKQPMPRDSRVEWSGAVEVERSATACIAECVMSEAGMYEVRSEVRAPDGRVCVNVCVFHAVEAPAEKVWLEPEVRVWARAHGLNEASTNDETVEAWFGDSIASLRAVEKGRYLTACRTYISLGVDVLPRGFGPLMEWRVDGVAAGIGASSVASFDAAGVYEIEVGPPSGARRVVVETYGVRITSHEEGRDMIPTGRLVRFEAETEPRGYEHLITWLASTKHGTALPVLGSGAEFVTRFDDVFGPHPDGSGLWQWAGVKADSARFGVDMKGCINAFGFDHCPLGAAVITSVPGGLLVNSIGAGGNDGVAVLYGAAGGAAYSDGAYSDFDPIELIDPEFGLVEVTMIGAIGMTPMNFGTGGIATGDGGLVAFADFGSLGCTDVEVQVLDGMAPVAMFTRPAGVVAAIDFGRVVRVGQLQGVIRIELDAQTAIGALGPPDVPVIGDTILLGPGGCFLRDRGGPTAAIECFEIRSGGIGGSKKLTNTQLGL